MHKYTLFSNNHFGGHGMSKLLQESRIQEDKAHAYDYRWSGLLVDMEELHN